MNALFNIFNPTCCYAKAGSVNISGAIVRFLYKNLNKLMRLVCLNYLNFSTYDLFFKCL